MGDGAGVKSLVAGYCFPTSSFVLLSCDTSGQLLVNVDNIDSITIASGANIVLASGTGVTINSGAFFASGVGVTINSGAPVSVSGNILIGRFSGETVYSAVPTSGRSRGVAKVTSLSGGDLLASGDCKTLTIRVTTKASGGTNDASGYMLIGYDATGERPFVGAAGFELDSGYGLILYPGDAYTVDINNMNKLRIVARLSGEMVSYAANVY